MKIAEALLLRKQLEAKVKQLTPIKEVGEQGLFELKTKRVNINDNTDEIVFQVPKIQLSDITAEFDHYASELRKIDSAIQQANWVYDIGFKEAPKPTVNKPKKK